MNTKFAIKRKIVASSIAFAFILVPLQVFGQNKVEVDKNYEQDISKIKKSTLSVNLPDSLSKSSVNFKYTIFDRKLKNIYNFSPLPATSLSGDRSAEYPSMVATATLKYPLGLDGAIFYQPDIFKGEAANTNSLSFSISTFNEKEKRKLLTYETTYEQHDSERYFEKNKAGLKGLHQNNSADANINYNHSWGGGEFDIDLFVKSNYSTYYGLPLGQSLFEGAIDNLRQFEKKSFIKSNASHYFNMWGANMNFKNLEQENTRFLYNLDLIYSHSSDKAKLADSPSYMQSHDIEANRLNLKENYLRLDLEGGPTIGKYSMVTFGIGSESAFYTGLQEFNSSLLNFTAQYQLLYKEWTIKLGAMTSLNFNNKKGWDHYHTYIVPKAEVNYAIIGSKLWFYGIADGGNSLNSYSSLLASTNWVSPATTLKESSVPVNLRAGLKGFVAKNLSFDLSAGYARHKGLLQLLTTSSFANLNETDITILPSPLDARYSSHDEVFVTGMLEYSQSSLTLGGDFKVSNFSKDEALIGKAKFESHLWGEFNHRERIFLGLGAHLKSKALMVPSYSLADGVLRSSEVYAKGYLNLSIYGRYLLNNHISIFAQVNNLLNRQIQNYGVYLEGGINGGIGLLIKF